MAATEAGGGDVDRSREAFGSVTSPVTQSGSTMRVMGSPVFEESGLGSGRRRGAVGTSSTSADGTVLCSLDEAIAGELRVVFQYYAQKRGDGGQRMGFDALMGFVADCRLTAVQALVPRVFADVASSSPTGLSLQEFLRALGILSVIQFPETPSFTDAVQNLLAQFVLPYASRSEVAVPVATSEDLVIPSPPMFAAAPGGGQSGDVRRAGSHESGDSGSASSSAAQDVHDITMPSIANETGPGITIGSLIADRRHLVPVDTEIKVILSKQVLKDLQLLYVTYSSTEADAENSLLHRRVMYWGGFVQLCTEAGIIESGDTNAGAAAFTHMGVLLKAGVQEDAWDSFAYAVGQRPEGPLNSMPAIARAGGTRDIDDAADGDDDRPHALTSAQFVIALGALALRLCTDSSIHYADAFQALIATAIVPHAVSRRDADEHRPAAGGGLRGGSVAGEMSGADEAPQGASAIALLVSVVKSLYRMFHWYTSEEIRRRSSTSKLRQQPMAGPMRYASRGGHFAVPTVNVPALKLAFRKLDVDGSGRLAGREVSRIVEALTKRLSPDAAATWLREVQDAQQGGSGMTFSEFMASFRLLVSKDAHLLFQASRARDSTLAKSSLARMRSTLRRRRAASPPPSSESPEDIYVVGPDRRHTGEEDGSVNVPSNSADKYANLIINTPEDLAREVATEISGLDFSSGFKMASSSAGRRSEAWGASRSRRGSSGSSASRKAWTAASPSKKNAAKSPIVQAGVMSVNQFLEFAKEFSIMGSMLSRAELLAIYRCTYSQQVDRYVGTPEVALTGIVFPTFMGALALVAVDALSKHPYNASESTLVEKITLFLRRLELSGGKTAIEMPSHENLFPSLGLPRKAARQSGPRARRPSDSQKGTTLARMDAWSGLYKRIRPISEYDLEADVYADMFAEMLVHVSTNVVGSPRDKRGTGPAPTHAGGTTRRSSLADSHFAAASAAAAAGFNTSGWSTRSPDKKTAAPGQRTAKGVEMAEQVLRADEEDDHGGQMDDEVTLKMLARIRNVRKNTKAKRKLAAHVKVPSGTFGASSRFERPRNRTSHDSTDGEAAVKLYDNISAPVVTVRDYHRQAADRRRRDSIMRVEQEDRKAKLIDKMHERRRRRRTFAQPVAAVDEDPEPRGEDKSAEEEEEED